MKHALEEEKQKAGTDNGRYIDGLIQKEDAGREREGGGREAVPDTRNSGRTDP